MTTDNPAPAITLPAITATLTKRFPTTRVPYLNNQPAPVRATVADLGPSYPPRERLGGALTPRQRLDGTSLAQDRHHLKAGGAQMNWPTSKQPWHEYRERIRVVIMAALIVLGLVMLLIFGWPSPS